MERLDLHRTRHIEVKRMVIRFIEDNWDSGKEIEIVTGHSSKMRGLVTKVLDEYNLFYTVGRELDYNKGYIVVWV